MSSRAMIVVAGGTSERFGSDKLVADVAGRTLLEWTLAAVQPTVDRCVVATREPLFDLVETAGAEPVLGGSTRTASELAGLAAIGDTADLIGIHDGARPAITKELTEVLFEKAGKDGSAIPVVSSDQLIVDRRTLRVVHGLVHAQTPQVFRSDILMTAYVRAAQDGFEGKDTAEVVQRYTDSQISVVDGDRANLKVTFEDDLERFRRSVSDPSDTSLR